MKKLKFIIILKFLLCSLIAFGQVTPQNRNPYAGNNMQSGQVYVPTEAVKAALLKTWRDLGHNGNYNDFLNWLKGAKGDQGIQGVQGLQGLHNKPY